MTCALSRLKPSTQYRFLSAIYEIMSLENIFHCHTQHNFCHQSFKNYYIFSKISNWQFLFGVKIFLIVSFVAQYLCPLMKCVAICQL